MKDKIINIVRKAIEIQKQHSDVTMGYGLDRHTYRMRGNNRFGDEDKYSRYWITSYPTDPRKADDCEDIVLYRNAPIATRIQECNVGGEFDMRILGKGKDAGCYFYHHAHLLHSLDFDKCQIEHVTEGTLVFSSLEKYLEFLRGVTAELEQREARRLQIEEEKKRAQSEKELKALEQELRKIDSERKKLQQYREEINNLTRYIHNQVQLRFHPIVDPIQTRIKTSHLYDGVSVVIDGGPGTGKTTTMISRLKYLIDKVAIEQDEEQKFNLKPEQRRALFDLMEEDKDWVFFSPSGLLRQYLAHAMENEKLTRPSSKVFYWNERLDRLMKDYGFFDPASDHSPFINAKTAQQNEQLLANTGSAVEQWEDYFVSSFRNKRNNLPSLENLKADWKNLALSIRNRMDGIGKMTLAELIDLFVQLSHYSDECQPYIDERKSKLDKMSDLITAKIRRDEETRNAILEIIKKKEQEEEGPDEPEIDQEEDNEVEELDTFTENEKILRQIRRWVEPYARFVYYKDKLSDTNQSIAQVVVPLLSDNDQNSLERIASLYLFNQYAACTRGAAKILFASIPTKYKSFRRFILKEKLEGWNLELVEELVGAKKNTRLHKQEQSLLIGFVNNLAVKILKRNHSAQHRYIDCYQMFCRPIIGIDEVTDFSDVDIYAMCSFAHKDFSAITLAGDLMQRLTKVGLHNWDELKRVLPQIEIMPLQTSYRQSVKMLDVARRLYIDTIGEAPTYKAHMREQKVPEAIAHISDNTGDNINWIEQRIKEIYKAYGNKMPSIAIFLNHEDRVANFAHRLKESDFFEDNGFTVIDGSQGETLGTSEQVRVFPIDKVKGMEFDVVFFVDVDKTEWSEELVKRYLYVGVSRAAFFLGVTMTEDNPQLSKYFNVGGTWRSISQQ